MLAQLGPKRALDQRLFQLFEQPVLSGQVLRLRVVSKQFVQKFRRNRRISRHVSLPLKVNSQKPTYTLFLTLSAEAGVPNRPRHADISRSDLSQYLHPDPRRAEEGADGAFAYCAADASPQREEWTGAYPRYGLHPPACRG